MTPVPRSHLWARWVQRGYDDPSVWVPRAVPEKDRLLSIWAISKPGEDAEGFHSIHPWCISRKDPTTPVLLPGPYAMACTLDEARALMPEGTARVANVVIHERYVEVWM